jgi:polyamine oxidase
MVPEGGKVIIVGAGFAGIGAARVLLDAGYDVRVLEARDRTGGRVHTVEAFGKPFDLGATWLHGGPGNPLKAIAARAGIPTRDSDYRNGLSYDVSRDNSGRPMGKRYMSEANRALQAVALLPVVAHWVRTSVGLAPSLTSLADLFQRAAARTTDAHEHRAYLEGLEAVWASPAEELGLSALLAKSATQPSSPFLPKGEQYVIGGMGRVFDEVAKDIPIELNCAVTHIAHDANGVRVQTTTDTYQADAAIVTVSVGLLSAGKISFAPALPSTHVKALQKLDMGVMNKVVMHFDRVFWPEDADYFMLCGGLCTLIWNLHYYAGVPVLTAVTSGKEGVRAESLSDGEMIAKVRADMTRAFGVQVPEPTGALITRWRSDPWALGSYSRLRPGSTGNEPEVLNVPPGPRLLLAGEALCSSDRATVHGAYWSGQRAAQRIAGFTAKAQPRTTSEALRGPATRISRAFSRPKARSVSEECK